ncbi:siroheme synthase CysG [Buchnera aphidicola (Kurisakia onigurumii)]|uniref:siroheme synthase CysG n=1 Tax=Buchnera aphidicola TaxID=9 RepID=UPI0031B6D0A6
MEYFPLFLNLKKKRILIIGGGEVAKRKVFLLLRSGALIQIIAKNICMDLNKLVLQKKIEWISTIFHEKHLKKVFLVISATNDKVLNSKISNLSTKNFLFVNIVDDKSKCSFIFPSIIDRNPVIISLTSSGYSPVLLKLIREKIESIIPFQIGKVVNFAKKWREKIKFYFKKTYLVRIFWEKVFNSIFLNQILIGQQERAFITFKDIIKKSKCQTGEIFIVGSGPGDPGLLTLRALQVIQQADIVLYDSLVGYQVLELARRDSKKFCVGKRYLGKNFSQKKINDLLIKFASKGNKVVRLKGGDPFIFGRGGEELEKIVSSKIPFQIIPGITAAVGIAAYTGIPLTHRKFSKGVIFIHGNDYDRNIFSFLKSKNIAYTIVIYMVKMNALNISNDLIKKKISLDIPVAIISQGTTSYQTVKISCIKNFPDFCSSIHTPILLIVGDVVNFYRKCNWFNLNMSNKIFKKNNSYFSLFYRS